MPKTLPLKACLGFIGSQITTLRELRNLTQEQLAALCGVSGPYIGQVERGQRNPTIGVLYAICEALDVSLTISFKKFAVIRYNPIKEN